jgi:hypothetical protein
MVSAEKEISCFDFRFLLQIVYGVNSLYCDIRTDRIREPEKQRLLGNGTTNSDATTEHVTPRHCVL